VYISTPIFEIDPAKGQKLIESGVFAGVSGPGQNNISSTFKGVVVSAIAAQKLEKFLEDQIHPKFNGEISFLNRNGTLTYAANQTFVGKNYFGDDFQLFLKSALKDRGEGFNDIINKAFISK
jgi:hypothetical protein